ncbi:MAG: hypothetical protein AAF629_01300, partial [Chloroflexota bacterium]
MMLHPGKRLPGAEQFIVVKMEFGQFIEQIKDWIEQNELTFEKGFYANDRATWHGNEFYIITARLEYGNITRLRLIDFAQYVNDDIGRPPWVDARTQKFGQPALFGEVRKPAGRVAHLRSVSNLADPDIDVTERGP